MSRPRTVAAFFDLDGTLIPGPSLEQRFFRVLRYRREVGVRNYLLWAAEAVRLLPRGFSQISQGNKMYLHGVQSFDKRDGGAGYESPWHKDGHRGWGQVAVPQRRNPRLPAPSFFAEAVNRVELHAKQGHTIVLMSGTLEPLAREAGRELEAELAQRGVAVEIGVCATQLEETNGNWTGRVLGAAMFGQAKARALRRIVTELGLNLARCYAYGNSVNDAEMLSEVGRPMAVNPSAGLARVARREQWPILNWGKEKDSTLGTLRTPKVQRLNQAKEVEQSLRACSANSGNGK